MQRAAAVAFAVALFAFVLPFATVSCDEARVEPTGAELVLRSAPDEEGTPQQDFELGQLVVAVGGGLATAAFLAFALSLLAAVRGWNGGWATLAGLVGVAALVLLKTRGGDGGVDAIVEVDAKAGGIIAAVAGAVGALVAGAAWLGGDEKPRVQPVAPVAALALLLFGYLYPVEHEPPLAVAYADTLDLEHPWDGAFWLLPVLVGILFLAKRQGLSRGTAAISVGVLAVVGTDVADEIGHYWRDDEAVGISPIAFLAGMITAAAWAIVGQWRQLVRPAFVPLAAGLALGLAAWVVSPANA